MIIGFTGTQQGMTLFQKENFIKILKLKECSEFHHGDCIGADQQAQGLAVENGITVFTIHPPLHDYKRAFCFNQEKRSMHLAPIYHPRQGTMNNGKTPFEIKIKWIEPYRYLERNKHIVDNVSLMIAAPKEHTMSIRSGTWSTIRYAWKTKKDIIIIPPIERPPDEFYTEG